MTTAWLPASGHILRRSNSYYLLILPGSLPGYEMWTLITCEHLQHIHYVIYFCIVADSIRRGERIFYFASIFPQLSSFTTGSVSAFKLPSLAALSVPDLCPFPGHWNSMLALAGRIRNRGKLGICSDSSEVVGILSLQLHGSQEWIKALSNPCVWHHWLISYYKIKSYLKISATVKASLPLPVLNWYFKSGIMYTGYFFWHVY